MRKLTVFYQNTFLRSSREGYNNSLANASHFRNCTFEVNNDFRGDEWNAPFKGHVTMWGVNGVNYKDCDFQNIKTLNTTTAEQLGFGIYTYDAGFSVKGSCSNVPAPGTNPPCPFSAIDPSIFKGLYYGIRADGGGGLNTYTAHGCQFENNIYGIQSNAVNFPAILQNRFEVGGNPYPIQNSDPIHEGIVINTGTGYTIEENEMLTVPTNGDFRWTVGTRIANTGAAPNQVYKNRYEGFYVGELANGNNVNISFPTTGLRYLCNGHSNNFVDIAITDDPNKNNDGISSEQIAVNNSSAGNTFSQTGSFAEGDFYNHGDVNLKYHHNGGIEEPIYYTQNTISKIISNQFGCPTNIYTGLGNENMSGTEVNTLKQNFQSSLNEYNNLHYTYSQLIDGGNTNIFLQNIAINWSDDAWELRAELLARSPYLSEDALKSAAEQGILPNAMLLEICLANPDLFKKGNLADFLATEIPTPMPPYMITILRSSWTNGSPRGMLESAIGTVQDSLSQAAYKLIHNWLQDSIQVNSDTLTTYLSAIPDENAKYALADFYLEQGQNGLAPQILQAIPTQFKFTEENLLEHNKYVELSNLKLAVKNADRTIFELSNEENAILTDIVNESEGRGSVIANNILCFVNQQCKDYPAVLPTPDNQQRKAQVISFTDSDNLKAYPNPASDFVTFEYDISDILSHDVSITVTDITGKTLYVYSLPETKGQVIWDTRSLSNGVYLYKLSSHDGNYAVGKLSIQH